MILYTENSKEFIKETIRLNKFNTAGYKINTENSIVFLYISNDIPKRKF